MANPENVERAFFKVQGSNAKIDVHFNPESLQYAITNNLKNKGKGNKKKQYVSDSTGKLTMDLIFDTTGSGEDVRLQTIQVAKFMEPNEADKAPPVVNFEWGLYTFKGMVETYKETIDYFSANGVPLRASVNITMSSQDKVFEGGGKGDASTEGSPGLPNSAIPAPASDGKGATGVATKAGNPAAAKDIASNNGLENMRFPGTASMEIGDGVSLKAPAAFASGGLGFSANAGLDLGIDVGAGISGGLDINASVGVGLSASVSASADAFSGLHAVSATSAGSATLNVDNFLDADITSNFGMDDQASFSLGGGAGLQGSASLKAEVGRGGELKAKIEFDGG